MLLSDTGEEDILESLTSDEADYQNVIEIKEPMILFFFIHLPSEQYALVIFSLRFFSIVFLLISIFAASDLSEYFLILIFLTYSIILCWLVVPIWQNYCVVRITEKDNNNDTNYLGGAQLESEKSQKDTLLVSPLKYRADVFDEEKQEPVEFQPGFAICQCCWIYSALLCCSRYAIVPRLDENIKSTRFMPLSVYNSIYMMRNPGKMLNPHLPEDMPKFSFSRSFLLVASTSVLGQLNMYIFTHAVGQLQSRYYHTENAENIISLIFAVGAALLAACSLKITLINFACSIVLIPFYIGMYCSLVCCDICGTMNPRNGSYLYRLFCYLWSQTAQIS